MEFEAPKPSMKGPAAWFTGEVWLDPIAQGRPPSRIGVSAVHFTPGARTAWHCHRGGQTLSVTDGEGRVQSRGEAAAVIRAGDIVYTPADEWHWHGAAPDRLMTHLSITDGDVEWGEQVTDDQYRGGAG